MEFVEAHAPAPFYVVDQGPIYAGPGIVAFPTVRKEYQSISAYPFIGHGYGHHHPHGKVVLWHQARVTYVDVKRTHRKAYRSAPAPLVRPPLNPRDK